MGLTLALTPLILSWLLTWIAVKFLPKWGLVSVSNDRSSHIGSVPSGGGIAFVIVTVIGLTVLQSMNQIPETLYMAIVGAGGLVAAIGFWDDRGSVTRKVRLLCQFMAAFWLLYWLGNPQVQIFGWIPEIWILVSVVSVLGIIWLINLYNFMDGTDGLATTQAILVLAFAFFVSDHHSWGFLIVPLLALLGFLPHNWPKAKIFMGDVGSGFLGVLLAALLLYSSCLENPILACLTSSEFDIPLWSWVILLSTFWVDATYTLIVKRMNGIGFSKAHNQHLYQKISRGYDSHVKLLLINVTIVVLWLYPLAYLAFLQPYWGFALALLAALPTLILCIWLRAGRP